MPVDKRKLINCFLWVILICGYPFVFSYILHYPSVPLIILLTAVMGFLIPNKKFRISNEYFTLSAIMLLFLSFLNVYHSDLVYFSSIIQVMIVIMLLAVIINVISIERFITQYVKIITFIAVIGAIGAVIVFIFNTPYLFQYPQQDGRLANVYLFTVTNTPGPPIAHPVIRYSGVFDEPGALAFFCMIALCLNKLYIHSLRYEKLLLYIPLLTFSMAHIITMVLYILLFKIKSARGYIIAGLFVLGIGIFIYSLKGSQYHQIYALSLERFEKDDSGSVKGNSRATESANAIEAFMEKPLLGIGIDMKRQVNNNQFSLFAMYGVLGYFLFQIVLFYYLLKFILVKNNGNKYLVLKCMFILFINLQQRPFNTNIVYFTSIMTMVLYCNELISSKSKGRICVSVS